MWRRGCWLLVTGKRKKRAHLLYPYARSCTPGEIDEVFFEFLPLAHADPALWLEFQGIGEDGGVVVY